MLRRCIYARAPGVLTQERVWVLDRIFSDQCDTFEYDWNSIRVSTHSHSSRTRTRTHRPVAVQRKSAIIMCERT
jgi:hypothetical protein